MVCRGDDLSDWDTDVLVWWVSGWVGRAPICCRGSLRMFWLGGAGVAHCRLTEPPASRLEIFTYRAESRRRDPSSPPVQAVGGREPWNALRHVFYWLNLVNPA